MRLNTGYLTLRRIEKLKNLNTYIWESISPYICGSDVLEIGAGVGVYTDFLLKNKKNVLVIEIIPNIINVLHKRFHAKYPNFEAIAVDASDSSVINKIRQKFDTIVCLNVLEHIEDDDRALSNMAQLLRSGGILILLTPSLKFLYGSLDKNLGHFRRYSYNEIESKLNKHGFSIEKYFYLHFVGIFGWFVRSHITKNIVLNKKDLKIYNALLPLFKLIDKITFRSIGLSLVTISKLH